MSKFDNLYEIFHEAATSVQVAAIAGVSQSDWPHHVFYGNGNFIGGRNRGRLPFIEIKRIATDFEQEANTLSREDTTFEFIVSTGRGSYEADLLASKLIRATFSYLKSNYPILTWIVTSTESVATPWGYKVAYDLEVETSAQHDDYGLSDEDWK